ncbi:MAG: hypothetical protein FJ247_07175 [Nitrospira sp.]|nr:hypothetical protein [Nitrospira sp.]
MPTSPLSQMLINCILKRSQTGLEGEGCLYELSAPNREVSAPDKLRTGDYVKIRFWLPDEDAHIAVDLAEVEWVESHWIKVDLLSVSPENQARLNQFKSVQRTSSRAPRTSEQILIRF